jgi:predicted house-cleaning noncanonical NTP pyrophosphatase (MazG superfamily)
VTVTHNKLVRDRIPEIIAATGRRPVVRELDGAAVREALGAKLTEEAEELRLATAEDVPGELADLLEVVRALAAEYDVAWEQVCAAAERKRVERGGFDKRLFLVEVADA